MYTPDTISLLHRPNILLHLKLRICLLPHLLNTDTRRQLSKSQATLHPIDLENTKIRDDRTDNLRSRQRQCTLLDNLRAAVFRHVVGSDNDLGLVRVADQIHRAAHALEDFAGDHEIGEVARGGDLERLWRGEQESVGMGAGRGKLTPRTETSTWPPRIMANDSELSNVEPPGLMVTVSLPAFMISLIW
jgi:hypothetical protein